MMKNGVYFIVASFLVAELLKILTYTKKNNDVKILI